MTRVPALEAASLSPFHVKADRALFPARSIFERIPAKKEKAWRAETGRGE